MARPVVGVAEEDRERTLQAVFARLGQYPGHLSVVDPTRPGPPSRSPRETPGPGARSPPRLWSRSAGAAPTRGGTCCWGTSTAVRSSSGSGTAHTVAPRANRATWAVAADGANVVGAARLFSRFVSDWTPRHLAPALPTRPEFLVHCADDIAFAVDAVYTWVDGNDPAWKQRKAQAKGEVYHAESASDARFISRDELRYSGTVPPHVRALDPEHLRRHRRPGPGLDARGPVRHPHRHPPGDLSTTRRICRRSTRTSIESQLHHIEGLAEHFPALQRRHVRGARWPRTPSSPRTAQPATSLRATASPRARSPRPTRRWTRRAKQPGVVA
ncbi:stealth family protein [Streptomyces thinghirensis]|nr:stealth family protein [Streptomyces thinghirensis]